MCVCVCVCVCAFVCVCIVFTFHGVTKLWGMDGLSFKLNPALQPNSTDCFKFKAKADSWETVGRPHLQNKRRTTGDKCGRQHLKYNIWVTNGANGRDLKTI